MNNSFVHLTATHLVLNLLKHAPLLLELGSTHTYKSLTNRFPLLMPHTVGRQCYGDTDAEVYEAREKR